MSRYTNHGWRKYIPYVEFHLAIPFIRFHTVMLRQAVELMVYDVCRVEWSVWRWNGGFRLYTRSTNCYHINTTPPSKKENI